MTGETKSVPNMPGRYWFVVAGLVWLAGGTWSAWTITSGIKTMERGIIRATIPGTMDLTLDKPGTQTIFLETYNVIDGHVYSTDAADGLLLSVTAQPSGSELPVQATTSRQSYSIGGRHGVSLAYFEIATPGEYRLTASFADKHTAPPVVLAVAGNFFGDLMMIVLSALGIGFSGLGAAVAIGVITSRRRQRAIAASQVAAGGTTHPGGTN